MSDAPRKRPVMREHELAKAVRVFVRDALDVPPIHYQFFAFDSAQKATDNQRARMIARGIVVGTPDTLLCVIGMRPLWCELKWGKGKPSEDQDRLLQKLYNMGHGVAVANSVLNYRDHVASWKVPLRANAALIAQDLDLKVAARIAAAETRAANPASGRVRAAGPRYLAGKKLAKRIYAP